MGAALMPLCVAPHPWALLPCPWVLPPHPWALTRHPWVLPCCPLLPPASIKVFSTTLELPRFLGSPPRVPIALRFPSLQGPCPLPAPPVE